MKVVHTQPCGIPHITYLLTILADVSAATIHLSSKYLLTMKTRYRGIFAFAKANFLSLDKLMLFSNLENENVRYYEYHMNNIVRIS